MRKDYPTTSNLQERRLRVFISLSAVFFGAMVLLNVIGLTRFVQLGPLSVAVGVLPYPLTFLITDLISELYGKKRANFIVWVGLGLNIFVLAVLYLGNALPSVEMAAQPPWQTLSLAESVSMPAGARLNGAVELYTFIYQCSTGAVMASMLSYMLAQFIDVRIFHFLKEKTQGRHLWLRNNVSTLLSQAIDSFVVIAVTFGSSLWSGKMSMTVFSSLLLGNYLFKMIAALLDTLPFYYLCQRLSLYLEIEGAKNW